MQCEMNYHYTSIHIFNMSIPQVFKNKGDLLKKAANIVLLFSKMFHNIWRWETFYFTNECYIPQQHNKVCITWKTHQSWSPFSSDKLDLLPIPGKKQLTVDMVDFWNITQYFRHHFKKQYSQHFFVYLLCGSYYVTP